MHIVKLFVTVSVLTLGASPLLAQAADNPAQADAREKLRQAEAALDSQQGIPPTTSPATPAPAPATPAPAPAVVQPAPPASQPPPAAQTEVISSQPSAPAPATTKMTPAMEQQLRDQLHQAEAQLSPQQASAPVPQQQSAPVAKIKKSKKAHPAPGQVVKIQQGQKLTFPAPAPIPSMLSGTKDQQLADLLQLYKSDKITPAEYHAQRAKILAQP